MQPNIFELIARANKSLRKAGLADKGKKMIAEIESKAESYEEAVKIISQYVRI